MSERLYTKYGIKFKKWIETKSEEVLDYKEKLKILYKEEQNKCGHRDSNPGLQLGKLTSYH